MSSNYGTWNFRKTDVVPFGELKLVAVLERWGWNLKTVAQDITGSRVEKSEVFKLQSQLVDALRRRYPELAADGWKLVNGSGLASRIDLSPIDGALPVESQRCEFNMLNDQDQPEAVTVAIHEGGSNVARYRASVVGNGQGDHVHFADTLESAAEWHGKWVRHLRRVLDMQAAAQFA